MTTPAKICHLVIAAPEIESAADFYESVFGWKVQRNVPGEGYWFFANDPGCGGALIKSGEPNPNSIAIYLEVPEIDETLKLAEAHGGESVVQKEHLGEGYGWRGALLDPCGNLVHLHTSERKGALKAKPGEPAQISHLSIPVKDLQTSADFYQTLFGWAYQKDTPDPAYWFWNNGDGHGGGYDPDAEPHDDYAAFFVEVPDIDASLEVIRQLGGEVIQDKGHIGKGLGYDAHFKDPAGNYIALHTSEAF